MRYRRLTYRYAVILATQRTRPRADTWPSERAGVMPAQPIWCPPADIYEGTTSITITLELAGVDQDEIEVLLFDDAVVVQGRRRLPPAEAGGVYHAAEIRQGPFRFEAVLPAPIDPRRVEARYERGLLQMTFGKHTSRQDDEGERDGGRA